MQGNCSSEPSAASLNLSAPSFKARKAGQCILVTDTTLMEVNQYLWLDNLYIQQKATDATIKASQPGHITCFGDACHLWMTSVTLQGAGKLVKESMPMTVIGGQVFASGAEDVYVLCIVLSCFDLQLSL
jgi:hypothetical protein